MRLFDWNSSIERDLNSIYRAIEELEKKMYLLFKKDHHGTERPKVDILTDNTDDFEQNVWSEMSKLQDRIEKLEKNK